MTVDTNASPAAETAHDSNMDKWVTPQLAEKIDTLTKFVTGLKNPNLLLNIKEILTEECFTEWHNTYTRLTTAELATLSALEFKARFSNNADTALQAFAAHGIIVGAIFNAYMGLGETGKHFGRRLATAKANNPDLTRFIKEETPGFELELRKAETERQAELDPLSIVTLDLPKSLTFLNSFDEIQDAAKIVLKTAFSKAVQGNVIQKMQQDMGLEPTASVNPMPTENVPQARNTFPLQLSVKPSRKIITNDSPTDNGVLFDNRYIEMLYIFPIVAENLSGAGLTAQICAQLGHPITPQTDANKPSGQTYDWIEIGTPNL